MSFFPFRRSFKQQQRLFLKKHDASKKRLSAINNKISKTATQNVNHTSTYLMQQLVIGLCLLLLAAALAQATTSSPTTSSPTPSSACLLSPQDWNQIKDAYNGNRNHFNSVRSICNVTLPTSLQTKHSACTLPLKTVLANQGYEQDCITYFNSTLYSGKHSSPSVLATKLCDTSFTSIINTNICNALSVPGCPRGADILKFLPYIDCYGTPLLNKTREYQLAYYANKADLACMRQQQVCEKYKAAEWDTCPLDVTDVFYFLDSTHETYTCEVIYPGAEERCTRTFDDLFHEFCPLPTEFEKNFVLIVVMCVLGPFILLGCGCAVYHVSKKPHLHHITRKEILHDAVTNFVSFDQPMKGVHPELQTVLAESKFKNVVFDKNTQTWGVLGEAKRYTNEKEAAQRAYLNMAKAKDALGPSRTKNSDMVRSYFVSNLKTNPLVKSSSASATNVRDFTSMELGETVYVVNATPLTPTQRNELRFRQLVAFYEFWEPEKPDIEEHSRNLLSRHDFDHVVRALKTKYGVCPPSWDTFNDV